MSHKPSKSSLRLLVLAAVMALGTIASTSTAEAQSRPGRVAAAKPAANAKVVAAKKAMVKEFSVKPHANLQRKIGNKPLLHISNTKGKAYEKHLDHSVELVFKPIGRTGHSYLRVGRKIYDHAFGARVNDFRSPTSGAYGFVMSATPKQIETLQAGFNQLMSQNPKFSMTGTGHNNTFSCAGFISYVMKNHAPELGVSLTPSAIGIASRLMRGQAEAVTVYGGQSSALADGSFQFQKL